jgi:type IV pilus assembly protein PilC
VFSSWRGRRVTLKEKIIFVNNLGAMLSSGLSLARALEISARQTENTSFRLVITAVLEKVKNGQTFSQSLGEYPRVFPSVLSAMVAAGEESGNLPQSLVIVRDQLTKTYELTRRVKGAMIYPAVILSLMVVIAILMMIFMVPTLTATFNDLGVDLPLLTRIIIALSTLMSDHYLIFVAGVAAALLVAGFFLRTTSGHRLVNFTALHVPVVRRITRELNAAITMRTISSLIVSGVSMTETLRITSDVLQNTYYRSVVAAAREQIEKGGTLSAIFHHEPNLFPLLVGELAEVGEETGRLSEMLARGAEFYEGEVDQATKNLSTIIEPLLMIIIGIVVGFFVIAMIGPMYSLTNAI